MKFTSSLGGLCEAARAAYRKKAGKSERMVHITL